MEDHTMTMENYAPTMGYRALAMVQYDLIMGVFGNMEDKYGS